MKRKKILAVNDERFWRLYLEFFLPFRGAELVFAKDGEEAIEKYKKGEKYSVIFMNIEMPIMDGLEATRELRRLGYKGDIFAWTAHEPEYWEKRCLEAGMNGLYGLNEVSELLEGIL